MKLKTTVIITALLLSFWLPAAAFAGPPHTGHGNAPAAAQQMHQGNGVIETVNPDTATVRLHHEPIESLGWPAMVMDLKVKDPDLLKDLKKGDRIVFDLQKTDKGYFIVAIEQET